MTLIGDFIDDGYGCTNDYMARGMRRAGVRVSAAHLGADTRGCSPEFRRLILESPARVDGPVLFCGWPDRPEFDCLAGTELFVRTTCDSSRTPPEWTASFNRARALIVPTSHAANALRASGVTVPIYLVPAGVDTDVYTYQHRVLRKGVTTLMIGIMEPHSDNYQEGIAAWQDAFRDDPDARLVIKSWKGWPDSHIATDPRVHVATLTGHTRSTVDWYANADVLLALGNEGFAATMLEAMATGLPVVALNSEAQSDVCALAAEHVLAVEPVTWRPVGDGVVGVPEAAEIAARLRWVARHRADATAMGKAAADWVREHRGIWNCGPDVLAVMEERTCTRRPLRHNASPVLRGTSPVAELADVPVTPLAGLIFQPESPPLWSYRPTGVAALGVVTLWNPEIDSWARQYAEDKRTYCERKGYAFYGYTDVFTKSRSPHWSKIPAVQRHLADHDWLYWIDADAAITNFDFDLYGLCDDDYDLIITHDELGVNTGSFLIRNTDSARRMLRRAWSQDVTDLFYEQTAVARAIALQPDLRVKVLDQRAINSFWNQHRPGHFVIHAAGQPTEVKIPLLEAFRMRTPRHP
ncbi:galactosyl transferase GMA12/MNN10 family protein [Nocardia tenerifensis]|uniref:Galactosyl transferase GMA12/MNN10 family protein n=1 Tax=Nocardia tenerifensis TaxID=228006 RepID=A0A318KAK0_9NOCA|nr:glycosyltransferase [Nocardia tenerifensis]PXX71581.1 galactosyl transferase GMA12/MNN10 family protein [Nocardia tenerifensis]